MDLDVHVQIFENFEAKFEKVYQHLAKNPGPFLKISLLKYLNGLNFEERGLPGCNLFSGNTFKS